ncbi:MAG: caspase family protein [Chitinophagaceae bacterium]|nr:caspase family protein [Chitinophagaceae bacterium]
MKGYMLIFLLTITAPIAFCQKTRLVLPDGHESSLSDAAFSPDGTTLWTLSDRYEAIFRLWDVPSGKLLFTAPESSILAAKYSIDGKKIFLITNYGELICFDARNMKKLSSVHLKKRILIAKFSNDASLLAIESSDSLISLLNTKTGAIQYKEKLNITGILEFEFSLHNNKLGYRTYEESAFIIDLVKRKRIEISHLKLYEIKDICFLPKTDEFVIATHLPAVILYDPYSGEISGSLIFGGSVSFESSPKLLDNFARINPDGSLLSSKLTDSTLVIYDMASKKILHILDLKYGPIEDAIWSKDNKMVVAMESGRLVILDSREFRNIHSTEAVPFESGSILIPDNEHNRLFFGFEPEDGYIGEIWDMERYSTISKLRARLAFSEMATLDNKVEKLYARKDSSTLRVVSIWSNSTVLKRYVQGSASRILSFDITQNIVLTTNSSNALLVWDLQKAKLVTTLNGHTNTISSAILSLTGQRIISTSKDKSVIVWDIKQSKPILFITDIGEVPMLAVLSPDETLIAITYYRKTDMKEYTNAELREGKTGKWIRYLTGHVNDISSISFSKDSKQILSSSYDNTALLWDASNGKILKTFSGHVGWVVSAEFSNDQNQVLTSSWDEAALLWDVKSAKPTKVFTGHANSLKSAGFARRDQLILTNSFDKTLKLWDIKTGKEVCSIYLIDSTDVVTYLSSGYYMCSKNNSSSLHYVTDDLKIITLDQLDIRYNRPDKVLESVGCNDTALIRSYHQAYYKRIRRLNFDTSTFRKGLSIPKVDFRNRRVLANEQNYRELRLQVNGLSNEALDRFNIWINEVPLYGQKGISLRKKNSKTIDTTITVLLSAGENQIETSVTDINGIESYRQPLYIKYNPEKPVKSNTYFIGIGINRFADSKNNLSWSVKDIRDLSQHFAAKGAIIDTLFDEQVTRANILSLKQRLAGTTEEDKVIIAYSGHGLLSSDFDYYLSTHTVNFSKPEENGLPYEELESLLDGIRARKKLMLIDACHSGEVDKEEITRYETATDSLQVKGTRGGKPRLTSGSSLGMKNSFELMQELFVNVGRSTGATVISAAGGTQFAQERGDLKNGVFSFVLLELLRKNKTVSISDLKNTVLKLVPELTNGLQKPTFRSETQRFDWSL